MGSTQEEEVLYKAWSDPAGVWIEKQGYRFFRTRSGGWFLTQNGITDFDDDVTITGEFANSLEDIIQRSELIEQ